MWIVGVGVFILGAMIFYGSTIDDDDPVMVKALGEESMRSIAIDGDSMEFRDVRVGYGEKGRLATCGEANGKNRLGGYTGWQRFVVIGGRVLTQEHEPLLSEAWRQYCEYPGS